jgi:ribose 5-phosphate isomerase B
MRVGIGADHAGFELKEKLAKLLVEDGREVVDFGNDVYESDDDYPDFVISLARVLANGQVERGVFVSGSGIGACVAANKVPGVRASLCYDHYSARQGVEDDDINLICLGGRTTSIEVAWECTKKFLRATFRGTERHRRRLAKVAQLEHKKLAA